MRLVIANLTGGGLSGGYAKYLRSIVPLLKADPRVERLDVFMPPDVAWPGTLDIEALIWPADDAHAGFWALRRRIVALHPDVVFIPTARWLDCDGIPSVVMVRNMEPLTVPFGGNPLLEGLKNLARAHSARTACRRASKILAVSNFVREFLIQRWRVPAARIGLVYHGVDRPLATNDTMRPGALSGRETAPFLFTAGSIRPARGLEDAIRALAILHRRDPTIGLVVAGRTVRGMEPYARWIQHLAHGLGVAGSLIWAGQLTAAEMAWCFDRSAAFVMNSRAEACPNTVLEALSHGCQVASTLQPPMPEFLGTAAVYYRPRDAADLAAQIEGLLRAPLGQRHARRDAARARAMQLTWAEAARRTIDYLQAAVPPVAGSAA